MREGLTLERHLNRKLNRELKRELKRTPEKRAIQSVLIWKSTSQNLDGLVLKRGIPFVHIVKDTFQAWALPWILTIANNF